MPAAARITDQHACPVHGGSPVSSGESKVYIGYQLAARVGDVSACSGAIVQGDSTVIIGYQPAARQGDPTGHGGKIANGIPNVIIGQSPQAVTLSTNKPFCEECERKRREREEREQKKKKETP